ncbi:MAG TPA: hypothetical protein VIC08_09130 [Cellvibrionaceae bacterium]
MRWLAALAAVLFLLYPFMVYLGSRWVEPRTLGLIIAGVWMLRAIVLAKSRGQRLLLIGACVLVALLLWLLNSELLLLLLPALISLAFAAVFGYSLIYPPTLPARMAARDFDGELPPPVLWYTTVVTRVWVGFFLANAAVSAYTALFTSRELWTLYNGFLAYVAIAAMFVIEYSYRRWIFMRKHNL